MLSDVVEKWSTELKEQLLAGTHSAINIYIRVLKHCINLSWLFMYQDINVWIRINPLRYVPFCLKGFDTVLIKFSASAI